MNKIYKHIKSFLESYNLDKLDKTYLVGFSGGPDSMCLLDILKKICPDNRIIALHLNHNWRGEESDKEEQNCAEFCKKIGVEFYSERLSEKISQNETTARNERYKFFEKCSKKFNSEIIFTAHNKNDNVETLIFRICHGTGITGLCGIAPNRNIYYRPMLDISRTEIEQYCKEQNLKPNIDSSNSDPVHKRNLIRAQILPLLEKVCANPQDSIHSLSKIAQEETEILKEYIDKILENISEGGKIKTYKFLELSEALQKRILYEIITPQIPENYDRERILIIWDFIKENSKSKAGKTISVTTNLWIFVSEKNIELITKKEKDDFCVKITKPGEYEYGRYIIDISECDSVLYSRDGDSSRTVFVDLSGITSIADLTFRHRNDGDIIQPLGMTGTQKLKKYLNSRKIPNHKKDELVLLANGNEVLWVAGMGLSEKIKVKTKPTHKITIKTEK